MAYKKFDDPKVSVDQAARKVYGATQLESLRRALQGISNRVLGGTNGAGPVAGAGAALHIGNTHGVDTTNPVTIILNGKAQDVAALTDVHMPTAGAQAALTATKFLLCAGTAGTGLVAGPGNIVTIADYASNTAALAACKLPDLPDGYCALGYITHLNGSLARNWTGASLLDAGSATGGTSGYVDLFCMPYND